MIKSVPIYDIDDSSMVVNTDDFWWWSWWWAVDSVNWKTWIVVLNQDNILDWTTAKKYTATEKTKLAWIQSWATANSTDAQLRDRTTHTGSQAISTITNLQTTLDWKQSISEKGQVNWYASLDWLGKVHSSQLPSYVDDVIEVADFASLPVTGETWKIYTTIDNNKSYRWWGSSYTQITDGKATWWGIDWLLSNQTDLQSALNNKVDKNLSITWATKTKITYDSKGLVVSWEDATTADIADSINKRYVTDADLIDIWNLSWINTWDETKATIESKLTGDITSHTHSWYANRVYFDPVNNTIIPNSIWHVWLPIGPWVKKTFSSEFKWALVWPNKLSIEIMFGAPPPPPDEE